MKKILLALSIAAILGACSCPNKKATETSGPISIDSFLVVAKDFVGKEVFLKGTVQHICKESGKRLELFTSCPMHSIHGIATDSLGQFDVAIEGTDVCVKGIVEELRMDKAYLDQWEAKIKEMTDQKDKPCMEQPKEPGHKGKPCVELKDSSSHQGRCCMEPKDSMPHCSPMDKLNECRKQVEASAEGFISVYSVKITSLTPCERIDAMKCCHKTESSAACCDTSKTGKHKCGDDCKHKDGCEKK
jgi:hypothetical protein